MRFLDTNIILRYLTRDDPIKTNACFALFQRVKKRQELLTTSEAVIAEAIYVLSSNTYRLTAQEIRTRLLPLILLPGLRLPYKRVYVRALELYVTYSPLDFEDVLNLAHMERLKIREIYSYDRDFNRVTSVKRREPTVD
jgi:predicted nucleic acid-binding protein